MKLARNKGAFFAYQSARKPSDFPRHNRFQNEGATLAGYADCLQALPALPPRPNRPDRWGRFGLGAFLNAGKNGHFSPARGVKIGFPFSRKGLPDQGVRLRRFFFGGLAKSGSVIFS